MFKLKFRVYGILNDFLPRDMRYRFNRLDIMKKMSIDKFLLLQGLPREVITLIIVNDLPVSDAYIIEPEDKLSFYPEFKNISEEFLLQKLRENKRRAKFLLTDELSKLGCYLSKIGFDCKIVGIDELNDDSTRVVLLDSTILDKLYLINFPIDLFFLKSTMIVEQIKEVLELFIPDSSKDLLKYCSKGKIELSEEIRRRKLFNLINSNSSIKNCNLSNDKTLNVRTYLN